MSLPFLQNLPRDCRLQPTYQQFDQVSEEEVSVLRLIFENLSVRTVSQEITIPKNAPFSRIRHCQRKGELMGIEQMVIVGVAQLHPLEIVQRDLKPQNIMVRLTSQDYRPRIQQLPLRTHQQQTLPRASDLRDSKLHRTRGAAEGENKLHGRQLRHRSHHLLHVSLPMQAHRKSAIQRLQHPRNTQKHTAGQYSYPAAIRLSPLAKDLIDQFLQSDPNLRISLSDALKHPQFEQLKTPHKTPRKPKPNSSIFSVFQ